MTDKPKTFHIKLADTGTDEEAKPYFKDGKFYESLCTASPDLTIDVAYLDTREAYKAEDIPQDLAEAIHKEADQAISRKERRKRAE